MSSRLFLAGTLMLQLSACNAPDSPGTVTDSKGEKKEWIEGKDYTILERVRIRDEQGFGQPVTAYSLLVPKGWKTEGGITWRVGHTCMQEVVNNRVHFTSGDGAISIDFFPTRSWEWNDDPTMLQAMQNNAASGFKRCDYQQPLDAGDYLRNVFLHEIGDPEVVSIKTNETLQPLMEAQARKGTELLRAAGVQAVSYRPTAVIADLRYPDGSLGKALCSVNQVISSFPNYLTGGYSAGYQCSSEQRILVRGSKEKMAEAEKILSTMLSSLRINPEWQAAVQQTFSNIAKVEQRENAKRAEITRQANEDISRMRMETWESTQQSQDRIMEESGRVLRGVEQWTDPATGDKLELTAGYNEAWSKSDGTYILSNDPLFDPNVVFQEDWKKLGKPN
ncbi:MAG: hypothetical protein U0X34_05890 [Bacteroidia bacterium]